MSSVSELIPVGGLQAEKHEGKKPVESPELSSMQSQTILVGGLPEQPDGKEPLDQLEPPGGKQQP